MGVFLGKNGLRKLWNKIKPWLMTEEEKSKLSKIDRLHLWAGDIDITDKTNTVGWSGTPAIGFNSENKIRIMANSSGIGLLPFSDSQGGFLNLNLTNAIANVLDGTMSKEDKAKIDGIAAGATADEALTNAEIDAICV